MTIVMEHIIYLEDNECYNISLDAEGIQMYISDDNTGQTVFNEYYHYMDCMMWDDDCYFMVLTVVNHVRIMGNILFVLEILHRKC